ncbi:hypothetical protein LT85_4883 [Collimonas arenae]|uniref:Transmembrane protein n=1 Tax=Collimonas arenae TaxID=279058 RepID=A0A0A1FHI1_9BURK|nr:hypothetical protein [Collimonas arenae]AIY44041.1 hypothetical protein LT85_4883 [Collimonas arenae]
MTASTPYRRIFGMLFWAVLTAFFFANVEIQIEGAAGWAANLPTWRIEHHWLLDIFWGGRAMTGYHAWVFPFIALMFHYPIWFNGSWDWRAESRIMASIMVFWISEDWLWFVLNPAYGLARFNPIDVPWHKHWLGGVPVDYWIYSTVAILLLWLAERNARPGRVVLGQN